MKSSRRRKCLSVSCIVCAYVNHCLILNNISKACLISSQVTDFGLSVQKGGVGSENMLQATCGTPIYMGNSFKCIHSHVPFTCDLMNYLWGVHKFNEAQIKMRQ